MISWAGFALSGLHPALGLLPVVPIVPQVHPFRFRPGWNLVNPSDMDSLKYRLRNPVEVILGLFALCNAGLMLHGLDTRQLSVSLLVLAALLIGKPLGIVFTGLASVKLLGLRTTLSWSQMLVVSCADRHRIHRGDLRGDGGLRDRACCGRREAGGRGPFLAGGIAWAVAKAAGWHGDVVCRHVETPPLSHGDKQQPARTGRHAILELRRESV